MICFFLYFNFIYTQLHTYIPTIPIPIGIYLGKIDLIIIRSIKKFQSINRLLQISYQ